MGRPASSKSLGQPDRDRRVALGRLEDEGVSARQRGSGLPQRDHRREVERGDACDHAERLAQRVDVDAAAGALGVFAFEQMRDADREFDDLNATLDVTLGVSDGLAVLDRQQLREFFDVLVDQVDELHHHTGAALRVPRRPVLLCFNGNGDGCVDVGLRCQDDLCLHLSGAGIEDVGGAGGLAFGALAVDEMKELCHSGSQRFV